MRIKASFILFSLLSLLFISCQDSKSFNEYLEDEEKAVNSFLANQRVELEIPSDTIFEEGKNAPFYKLDEDGNVYMQVIKSGDRKNNKAEDDQTIYFRYGRIDIIRYSQGYDDKPDGNFDDVSYDSFRYNNYSLESSYQYGTGIQMPLIYLGIDCEVNILIKSQYGFTNEMANVTPYLYNVRYFKQKV